MGTESSEFIMCLKPSCKPQGQSCENSGDCCDDNMCKNLMGGTGKVCGPPPPPPCEPQGQSCENSGDCCDDNVCKSLLGGKGMVCVALLRALVVQSNSAVEGALAMHCTMAMIPFASCEGLDAPSRQSARVHDALASGDERLDSATMHMYGYFPIKLASTIHVWRQVTTAPLPCTAISC